MPAVVAICVLLPTMISVAAEARLMEVPETTILEPGSSVWLPTTYLDEVAVITLEPIVRGGSVTGAAGTEG